jgi:hypothetical protein
MVQAPHLRNKAKKSDVQQIHETDRKALRNVSLVKRKALLEFLNGKQTGARTLKQSKKRQVFPWVARGARRLYWWCTGVVASAMLWMGELPARAKTRRKK